MTRARLLFSNEVSWLAYCGVIVYLSSVSGSRLTWMLLPDYILHVVEFAVLGILTWRVFRRWFVRGQIGLALLFCAFFGAFDEFHQLFTPGRMCELKDLIVDVIGAAAGIVGCHFVQARMATDKKNVE